MCGARWRVRRACEKAVGRDAMLPILASSVIWSREHAQWLARNSKSYLAILTGRLAVRDEVDRRSVQRLDRRPLNVDHVDISFDRTQLARHSQTHGGPQ